MEPIDFTWTSFRSYQLEPAPTDRFRPPLVTQQVAGSRNSQSHFGASVVGQAGRAPQSPAARRARNRSAARGRLRGDRGGRVEWELAQLIGICPVVCLRCGEAFQTCWRYWASYLYSTVQYGGLRYLYQLIYWASYLYLTVDYSPELGEQITCGRHVMARPSWSVAAASRSRPPSPPTVVPAAAAAAALCVTLRCHYYSLTSIWVKTLTVPESPSPGLCNQALVCGISMKDIPLMRIGNIQLHGGSKQFGVRLKLRRN